MTKTLLELAREATPGPWKQHLVDDTTVVAKDFDVCCTFPSGGLDDEVDFTATVEQHEINAAFIAAANPQRIIELCEAIEKLIHSIEVHTHIASDNAPDTCAECGRNIRAQAHRYVGEPSKEVQQREAIAFARRALKGE